MEDGESWDYNPFRLVPKKRNLMIEIPAGSGIYYQCWAEKLSWTEVYIRIPREPPEESEYQWLNLASSRIWRGSMAGKSWICLSPNSGSWKPKTSAKDRKPARKHSRASAGGEYDEPSGATPQDTDLEEDADRSPSLRPAKGSNAVSPATEEPGNGSKRKRGPATADRDLPEIKPDPDAEEPSEAAMNREENPGLQEWFHSHWNLMHHRGLMNNAASMGPESGLVPAEAATDKDSAPRSQARRGTQEPSCSSSSSAGKVKDSQSHLASLGNPSADFGSRSMRSGAQASARRKPRSDMDYRGGSRSTSPATPNKHADGYRAAQRQRSSSMDLDPRSATAGLSSKPSAVRAPTKGKLMTKSSSGTDRLPASKKLAQASTKKPQSSPDASQHRSLLKHKAAKDGVVLKANRPASQNVVKSSSVHSAALKQKVVDPSSRPPSVEKLRAAQERLSSKAASMDIITMPALVETDPFEITELKRRM